MCKEELLRDVLKFVLSHVRWYYPFKVITLISNSRGFVTLDYWTHGGEKVFNPSSNSEVDGKIKKIPI